MPRNYHVQQEDFDLAADLVRLLRPFYEITLQLSTKASARIAEVVLMIDQITSNLAAVIAKQDSEQDHPPALRNACRAGLRITNKYYSLTDCSPLYRIAMGRSFLQLSCDYI
jgi:DNA-binding transcriptional regulator WhiA